MQTPTQIKSSIITFLFFKIEFDSDLNSFVYKNREPLNEINEDFFEPELGEIFKNIVNNLQVGKENLVFLKDHEDIINKKSKHFEMFKMNSFTVVFLAKSFTTILMFSVLSVSCLISSNDLYSFPFT